MNNINSVSDLNQAVRQIVGAFEGWRRWRAIQDKITANPHYRHDDPKVMLLLKLSRMASLQMAHFNQIAWGNSPLWSYGRGQTLASHLRQ